MKKQTLAASLAFCCTWACLPRQQYVYPVALQEHSGSMSQHLQACAADKNYSARELMHMTWVNLDKDTLLVFDFKSHDEPRFTVRQDHLPRSAQETQDIFDSAKEAGQDLLHCAHARTLTPG